MKFLFGAGINESQVPNIHECGSQSQNFELSKDSYKLVPRPPFDLKITAPNAAPIRGIMQLVKRNDSATTLVQAGATVYEYNGTVMSSRGTCVTSSQLRGNYWSLDDYIVITDLQKATVVKKWDGTTFSTQTTGLGVDLYAKYGIVHNGRMWLFNVTSGAVDTPHLMVASAFENATSFSTTQAAVDGTFTTGLEAFYILSPDLRPINGVALTLAGDLVISTIEGRLFRLTGSSAADYAFVPFYPGSQCVGNESMASIGNDIIYLGKGGRIDALSSTQNYGDVSADDLSRYIPESTSGLTDAITVYDQQNQKVLMFVAGKVLVLFKDILYGGAVVSEKGEKAKLSPWSIYTTNDDSNFNTAAAAYIRIPGETGYSVFFGDDTGRLFNLNGEGFGDAGDTDILVTRTSRFIDKSDGMDFMRHITRGAVQYRRLSELEFSITLDWGDEYNSSTATVMLDGPPSTDIGAYFGGNIYFGGTAYFNQGFSFANKISHKNFSNVGKAPGCFVTFSAESSVNTFQIDNVELM